MTPLQPGLPVSTPHGFGVVASVRSDGMVVTRLAGINNGAPAAAERGQGYIGYFHPSSVCVVPSPTRLTPTVSSSPYSSPSPSPFAGAGATGAGGGRRSGSAPSLLPSATAAPPAGMFQPVCPDIGMDCGGNGRAGKPAGAQPPLVSRAQNQHHQLHQLHHPLQQQQQQQQQQQHSGYHFQQTFGALERPRTTAPPPTKRRRSAGGNFGVSH
ncbi:unnamed protein product [Hapterophycus canaliculatus]